MSEAVEVGSTGSVSSERSAVGRLLVERLYVENFRNLGAVLLSPAPRLNLIHGDNGHGKTSLIEALYVLATTRSFRTTRLGEVIRTEKPSARLMARTSSLGLTQTQEAGIFPRNRSFSVDEQRVKRHLDYAVKTPVIVFHPGDLGLVHGAAGGRRTLLDRVGLYLDPAAAEARLRYQEVQKERQALLAQRGIRASELDVYEELLSKSGAAFARARKRAAERVKAALVPALSQMAPEGLSPVVEYQPGGTEDPEEFRRQLQERRQKDLFRGAATFGPQRDELRLELEGRPARSHASQGQQRLLTLALKIAELDCVRSATGLEPILLLDDISSELDPTRTEAVFRFLRETESQVFVTTTRPQLFAGVEMAASERADFRVLSGALSP